MHLKYSWHNVILVSGIRHSDSTTLYIMLCSPWVQLLSVTIQCYYNNTDYTPFAIPFILVICSLCNWKPVPPTLLHPFCSFLHPLPLWQPSVFFSVFMGLFLLSCLFYFLDATYNEIIWHLYISVWIISLSIIPSRSMHVVANGKIHSFLWLIFHCIYIPLSLYPFNSWWTFGFLP